MADSVLRVIPSSENHCQGHLWWRGQAYACALGKGGVLPANRKSEGDDASPAGVFSLRSLYYRADRLERAETGLPTRVIDQSLGWCDETTCVDYNSAVTLPHGGSAEELWRADGLYDLLVVIGHNTDPVIPNMGSAIVLHIARDDFSPTRGCVAVAREALLSMLPQLDQRVMIRIQLP